MYTLCIHCSRHICHACRGYICVSFSGQATGPGGMMHLDLLNSAVNAVNHYRYKTKIMFQLSSEIQEHVRNALTTGAHTITVPLKILKSLTENHFTTVGTEQFLQDTRLMTVKVKDAI